MKKRGTNIILTSALALSILCQPLAFVKNAKADGDTPYTYSVISEAEKTIRITGGKSGVVLDGDVIIPSEIDGYTVISLGNAAFGKGLFKNVTSVVVPDTVRRIEDVNCFYDCKKITHITLPEEMDYIGTGTFTGCSSLVSIVLPKGIKTMSKTFRRCTSLKSVTIPSTVTSMDAQVFGSTDSASDVMSSMLSSGVIKCAIGSYAEQYAKSKGISVKYCEGPLYTYSENGDGTITIDSMALDVEIMGTLSVPSVYDGKTVTGIGERAFYGRNDILSITLPATVKTIGSEAFANCKNISIFEIPDGVTTLDKAFLGCKSLKTVTIPDSVTSISEETFFGDLKTNGGGPIKRLVIYCSKGSAAESYAKQYSIDCEADGDLPKAWDGTVDISWYDKDEITYHISTAAQLAGLRYLVNSGTELFYGKIIELDDDINMAGTVWKTGIGYYTVANTDEDRSFNGAFEGNEHKIFNFTYNSNAELDTDSTAIVPAPIDHKYHGLFANLGIYGSVRNLALENSSVTAGTPELKLEGLIVGTIAGRTQGEIKHCYISDAALAGGYYGSFCSQLYGGICGANSGRLEDCFVKNLDFKGVTAQINAAQKGGIAASNSGSIINCYVSNLIYDDGQSYYTWNDDGSGKDKCPVMFYFDSIVRSNSGTVKNVYSSDSFARDGWTVGKRSYEGFSTTNEKMNLAFEKLTFRTIAPVKAYLEAETAANGKTDINPQIILDFSQPANIDTINSDTLILKLDGENTNSFYIDASDDERYPYSCKLRLNDDLLWQKEYEISASGIKDFWNRDIPSETLTFTTDGEIVFDAFELYENYGEAGERKITSISGVSGPVTAIIKGLRNNGINHYPNAVFSVFILSDGQIAKGAAVKTDIESKEIKTEPVKVTAPYGGSLTGDVLIQAVLYKAPDNAVPLVRSVQAGN